MMTGTIVAPSPPAEPTDAGKRLLKVFRRGGAERWGPENGGLSDTIGRTRSMRDLHQDGGALYPEVYGLPHWY